MDSANMPNKPSMRSSSKLLDNASILKSILKNSGAPSIKNSYVFHEELSSAGQHEGDVEESLVSGIANKIKNVDGQILRRDGKVLKTKRVVTFDEQVENLSKTQNEVNEVDHEAVPSGNEKAIRGLNEVTTGVSTQVPNVTQDSNATQVTSNTDPNQRVNATVDSGNIRDNGTSSCDGVTQTAPKLSYASMFKTKNVFKSVNICYTEVGLSLITTQIGKPIMLDSYTSTMCVKSWGRNSYARALVEVSSINELMDHVVVAIPYPNGLGHSLRLMWYLGKGYSTR
jgi:hypothetical protein